MSVSLYVPFMSEPWPPLYQYLIPCMTLSPLFLYVSLSLSFRGCLSPMAHQMSPISHCSLGTWQGDVGADVFPIPCHASGLLQAVPKGGKVEMLQGELWTVGRGPWYYGL